MTGQSETKHTAGTMVRDGHNMSSVIICTVPRGHPDAKHLCGDYETIARCEGDNWSANAARIALTWNCHDELVAALKAMDDFWTEAHPAGPDGDPTTMGGLATLTADTLAVWRGIRAALSRALSPTP